MTSILCVHILHSVRANSLRMDLTKIKSLFEGGPDNTKSTEGLLAMIFARHIDSFRETFVSDLDDFRVIARDRESHTQLELCGAPHRDHIEKFRGFLEDKPDHQVFVELYQKYSWRRLQKGAHSICLHGPDRIELWIEKKDTSAAEPEEDDEDRANEDEVMAKHAVIFGGHQSS